MKIAVISDLHIGTAARAVDYCPEKDRKNNCNAVDQDYQKTFIEFIKNNDISADIILMPGDLSNQAKLTEFELGSKILLEIAAALGTKDENIFCVPGNHDVDWSVFNGHEGDELLERDRLKFTSAKEAKNSIFIKNDPKLMLFKENYFHIWEHDEIIVVGFNSSAEDNPLASVHHGGISQSILKELGNAIEQYNNDDRIKLFLGHHHPVNHATNLDFEDYSIMQKGGDLIELLSKNSFDFLVHGHIHIPKLLISKNDSGYPINILCAGSFSVALDNKYSGHINNQFHIIERHSRDLTTRTLSGLVRSWSFLSHLGWIESRPGDGIHHKMPFGSDVQPENLKKAFALEIQAAFNKNRTHYTLSELDQTSDAIKYVPFTAKKNALEAIKDDLGFDVHPSEQEIIILKKDING